MDDLIYSLNATMPVFLVIAAGYLLGRTGMFSEGFIASSNKFIFNVCLPLMIFRDMAQTDIRTVFDGRLAAYSAAATTAAFILIWVSARLLIKDRTITGAFVQAAYRSSVAVMGFAFMQNIYGGVGLMPMIIIGCVPLYNIYAVTVLTFEANVPDGTERKRSEKIGAALRGIVTNPIIIGIVTGTAASLLGIWQHIPVMVTKTADSIAAISTPLSLIVIGASFEGKAALAKLRPTAVCCVIKLLIMPLFMIPAIFLGIRGQALLALVIMLGSPTTPSCYIMAKNMNNDGVLTSSVITATTFLSSITLTLCIFIVKSIGLL